MKTKKKQLQDLAFQVSVRYIILYMRIIFTASAFMRIAEGSCESPLHIHGLFMLYCFHQDLLHDASSVTVTFRKLGNYGYLDIIPTQDIQPIHLH